MMGVWSRAAERQSTPGVPREVPAEQFAEQSKDRSAVEEEDMCFVYPLLQPAALVGGGGGGGGGVGGVPWSKANGYLRFSIFFANPFNR